MELTIPCPASRACDRIVWAPKSLLNPIPATLIASLSLSRHPMIPASPAPRCLHCDWDFILTIIQHNLSGPPCRKFWLCHILPDLGSSGNCEARLQGPWNLASPCFQNQCHVLDAAKFCCQLDLKTISLDHHSFTVCWSWENTFLGDFFFTFLCLVENPSSSNVNLDFTFKWICIFYKMLSQCRRKLFSLMVLISSPISAALNLELSITLHLIKRWTATEQCYSLHSMHSESLLLDKITIIICIIIYMALTSHHTESSKRWNIGQLQKQKLLES